jgi:replication factor C subunit 1
MPVHGVLSTVLPAYYTYGTGSFGSWNGGGENARAFPGWFGKNSTQGRLQRSLTDIQIHMRLKVSGDKREIRQSYIPALSHKLVQPLIDQGTDGVSEVIKEMDEYYLSKDEWDAIVEMGIGENTGDALLKKIPTQTKSAFTRKYNSSDHPIPFHKATDIAQSKKMPAAEKPDFEEAFEVEAEADPEEEEKKPKKGEDENTIKDKLVKAKKPKAASAAKGKAAAGGKAPAAKGASAKAAPKSKSTKK